MHVGFAPLFQNPGNKLSDVEVYERELRFAELAEPLGFDSVWSVEHHFTDYTMCPDVLQFLSFMAGRTQRARLGSMVVVLPWHDPVRVAEQIAMLDHMSGGRLILGLGRGLGRVEFDGFRLDMNEARQRFVEYAKLVLDGLERGYIEGGETLKQPRRDIRPFPLRSFRGRTFAAAVCQWLTFLPRPRPPSGKTWRGSAAASGRLRAPRRFPRRRTEAPSSRRRSRRAIRAPGRATPSRWACR